MGGPPLYRRSPNGSLHKRCQKRSLDEVYEKLSYGGGGGGGGGVGFAPLFRWSPIESLHKMCQKNLKEKVIFQFDLVNKTN